MTGQSVSTITSPIVEGNGGSSTTPNAAGSPAVEGNGGASATVNAPAPAPTPAPSPEGTPSHAPSPEGTPAAPSPEGAQSPAGADGDKNKTTPDWAQKRINELTAKRYEADRLAQQANDAKVAAETRAADLLAQIAKGTTGTPSPAPAPSAALGEDEIERRAVEKAGQMAAASRFNEACDNVADAGRKEFKDWDSTIKNLSMVGAVGPNSNVEFLQTAIELKNPHQVLHHLGEDLELADRIVKMTPTRRALELARIEAALSAPKPVAPPAPLSGAPAPVIPLAGGAKPGPGDLSDPNLESSEWFKLRDQQAMERKTRYRR